MKGIRLNVDGMSIVGAISGGITGVILSYREREYSIVFSSLDDAGMKSTIWFSGALKKGSKVNISFEEIETSSEPQKEIDYGSQHSIDQQDIETYYRLKEELTKDGLITN